MRSSVTTAIVPAAGLGTRMRPLTDVLPKELLPLGRKTALQHIVSELASAGIHRIVFVTSPAKETQLQASFGSKDIHTDVSFEYAVQTEMLGLGDAVLRTAHHVVKNEPFLVALGDAVISEREPGGLTSRMLDVCGTNSDVIGLTVQKVARERISRYGIVKPVVRSRRLSGPFFAIDGIVEKPSPESAPSEYAVAARYVLPHEIFAVLSRTRPDSRGEVQLTSAIGELLSNGNPGIAVPLQNGEVRHDIGGFDSYYRAFVLFALADSEASPDLRRELMKILSESKEPVIV